MQQQQQYTNLQLKYSDDEQEKQFINNHSPETCNQFITNYNNNNHHHHKSVTFLDNYYEQNSFDNTKCITQHSTYSKRILVKFLSIFGIDSIIKRHRKSFRRKVN